MKNFQKNTTWTSLVSLAFFVIGITSGNITSATNSNGTACTQGNECESGICQGSLCVGKKLGTACNADPQCKSNHCEDSFCDCAESPSEASKSCAAEYGLTSDLNVEAAKWKCEDEGKDPDKNRGFLDFCVNRSFNGPYPANSTNDVKYPIERKAYMGEPCYYSSVCLSQGTGGDDVCNDTGIQSTETNDPWHEFRSTLNICECISASVHNPTPECSAQYGPGEYTCDDGPIPNTGGTNVCRRSDGWIPQSLEEMKKWSGPPLSTPGDNSNKTTIFGFDATIPNIDPVQPAPKIGIPGVVFSKISKESSITTDESGASWLNVPFLGEYIAAIYKYSVGLISLIAVMVLIISGVQIVTSAGNSETITAAKHRIVSSVIAIALTAGSYTILYTINPELVNLRNLKILVVQTKLADFKPEFDDKLDPADAPAKNGVIFPVSNKLLSPTAPATSNPIPSLIGPLPTTISACSKEAFNYTAKALTSLNICVGPCNCAYTASHFLNYAGCNIPYEGNVNKLKNDAIKLNWMKTTISNSNKTDKSLPIGLFWMNGHVGVSLGDGQLFDSSANHYYKVEKSPNGGSCPPPNPLDKGLNGKPLVTVFDIVPNDNTKNCNKCSVIPSIAPITGDSGDPNLIKTTYPNSLMKDIVHGGANGCESIQFWGIRPAPGGFTEIYTPPNAQ